MLLFLLFPLLGIIAAVAVAVTNGVGGTAQIAAVTPVPITLPPAATPVNLSDHAAPDFSLRTLDQTTVSLSDYKGRIVFLNFWATWCVPCQRELPAFTQFMASQTDKTKGPIVLGVNLGETYDNVKSYLDAKQVAGFPILLDVDYKAVDLYGVGPIPVTFVVDPNGVIRYSKYGEMKPTDIQSYLDAVKTSPSSS
jgi:peroxiredoxin